MKDQMTKDEQIKGMANPNRGFVGVQEARPQRTWVDLTPQALNEIFKVSNTGESAVLLALKKIKEKNEH